MQRDITLLCSNLLRCSLSFALYNIVLLVHSTSPHIKVILPPNSTTLGGHVIFIHFLYPLWTRRLPKIKSLLLLISCHQTNICISIPVFITVYSYFTYPNLTYLLSSFGVKLDNGVVPYAPRSPPRLTVFNRHPLFHNPVICVQRLTGWSSTSQPLSRHIYFS